jgi:beta-galactosidase
MKDDANALWPERQPGPLESVLGARVEQFYALDNPVAVSGDAGSGKASVWAEWLDPQASDVRVLARYADPGGWLDNKPAIVTRTVGKGSITYIGAWLDVALLAKVAHVLLDQADIAPLVPDTDPDLEIGERAGDGKRVLIAINHGDAAHPIALPQGARLIAGTLHDGRIAAHDVAVLRLDR